MAQRFAPLCLSVRGRFTAKDYVGTGEGDQEEAERRAWNRNIKRATNEGIDRG
jgi:hypothetical protein